MRGLTEIKCKPRVNDDLIGMLEDMLEAAKSGEITHILGCVFYNDGSECNVYTQGQGIPKALGYLRLLSSELEGIYNSQGDET